MNTACLRHCAAVAALRRVSAASTVSAAAYNLLPICNSDVGFLGILFLCLMSVCLLILDLY